MPAAAVDSAFDIAYWFVDRALNDNEYLQPQKMQRLMYLSQAYFAVAYSGRRLMPALFIADELGPLEPNVYRACAIQRPAIEPRPLGEAVEHFLDSIWRRFGPHSADYLSRLVMGHPPYLDAVTKGPKMEITLQAMATFYGKKSAPPQEKKAAPGPVTMQIKGQPTQVQQSQGQTLRGQQPQGLAGLVALLQDQTPGSNPVQADAAQSPGPADMPDIQQLIRPRMMRSQSGAAVTVQKWSPPVKK